MAQPEHDGNNIPVVPTKDPDSNLDYGFDWTDWLVTGESIASSSWILPSDLVEESTIFSANKTSIYFSGGVSGYTYTVTNRIVTDSTPPRTEDRSFTLPCRQK